MGKRGPQPIPEETRARTGVRLRRSGGAPVGETPQNQPIRPSGSLTCPDYLTPAARPYWDRLANWVNEMGLGWPCDEIKLSQAAELWWLSIELQKQTWGVGTTRTGVTMGPWTAMYGKDPGGKAALLGYHASAKAKALREVRADLNKILSEFGFSPSARNHIRLIPPPAMPTEPGVNENGEIPTTAGGSYDFAASMKLGQQLRGPRPLSAAFLAKGSNEAMTDKPS